MKFLFALIGLLVVGAGVVTLAPVSQDGGGESGGARSAGQDKTGDSVVDRLLDEETWQEAADQIREERRKRIEALLSAASLDSRNGLNIAKYRAIELLAELAAPEACELLIREIDLVNHPTSDGFGTASVYPAAAALVKIGMPAVRALYRYLRMGEEEGEISEERLSLTAWVLEEVYGSRRVARAAVEEEMQKKDYSAASVQARFRRILSIYDEEDRRDRKKAKEREEKEKERGKK